MSEQTDNRRTHRRYYYKALVRVAESSEYSNVTLESINISAGGIFFRADRDIRLGEKLTLLFRLPGREEEITAKCEVVHNLETIPGKQYFIGAEFDSLDNVTFEELTELLADRFD